MAKDSDTALLAVLLRGFESKDLDYKGPAKWDDSDKKAKCELVKDILAMANSLGGYLVIGVAEDASHYRYDGLTEDQAKSYDSTKINSFVQTYADPPINTLVKKVEHEGKTYVIIEVPRFADTPHLCQKDFPNVLADRALYVRTDNNESAAIKSSADFRYVIEQAVRNRSDSLLTSMRAILLDPTIAKAEVNDETQSGFLKEIEAARQQFDGKNPLPNKGYEYFLECWFAPDRYVSNRFDISRLRSAAFEASVDYTGWPFLFIHHNRPDVLTAIQDGLETLIHSHDDLFGLFLDFWRFYQSGLFYKKELPQGSEITAATIFPYLAQYFAQAVDCLCRLYEKLIAPTEVVSMDVTILGTAGRRLINDMRGTPLFSNYTCNISSIHVKQKHTLAEWKAGIEDHAIEMLGEVQIRFNWIPPSTELAHSRIKQMFARTI